jgi:hypothetical protein
VKCLRSLGFGGRDTYFHDFESCEQGDRYRPPRPSDLSGPACLLVLEHDEHDDVGVGVAEG